MSKSSVKSNKRFILIIINLAAFLAALIVFFTRTFIETEKEMTIYSALEEPKYPVISMMCGDTELNLLHGYAQDMGNKTAYETITPLPENRKLGIRIDTFGSGVAGLTYEIRSLDLSHYIEKTAVEDFRTEKNAVYAELPIQNMLVKDAQYLLTIHLDNGEYKLNYYTRIVLSQQNYAEEMVRLALDFNRRTFHYDEARELISYLEISDREDNSSLGNVTINSNFSQLTWGSTGMQLYGNPRVAIRQLDGIMGAVEISYMTQMTDESGKTEYFTNTDHYTFRMGTERIYLMNYRRRTDSFFDGSREHFSGKRINLGITNPENLAEKDSDNHRFIAFKANRDLWLYDQEKKRAVEVFSFRSGMKEDIRNYYAQHDIRILSLSDAGEMDFVVYGYMNRGKHEGWDGIAYYRYNFDNDTLEELFFIPSANSFEKMRLEIDELCRKGGGDMFYIKQNGAVTGIDITSLETITYVTGLEYQCYAVSADQSRIAWLAGNRDSSDTIRVLNVSDGETSDIKIEENAVCRIIGYSDNNLIYGIADRGASRRINGRKKGLPMNSLAIVDESHKLIKEYRRDNSFIDNVSMNKNRIYLDIYRKTSSYSYQYIDTDTIVYNPPGEPDQPRIRWTDGGVKKKTWYVTLDNEIKSTRGLKAGTPSNLSYENSGTAELNSAEESHVLYFYVCNFGRLICRTTDFGEAVRKCYDSFGYILDDSSVLMYNRANRDVTALVPDALRLAEPAVNMLYEMETSVRTEDAVILDAQGIDMEKLLNYIYAGLPVIARVDHRNYCIIYGYDKFNVRLLYPLETDEDKRSVIMGRADAADYFAQRYNDFTAIVYYQR